MILQISHAMLPDEGEDSFALRSEEQGAFLCVSDGCGGLGSRRHSALGNHTEAYIASRLVSRAFLSWANEQSFSVWDSDKARTECAALNARIDHMLAGFASAHCTQEKGRISGTMQRRLPATICALAVQQQNLCFFWAGDSRGYVLDEDGLHQYTRDHLKGFPDSFDALYGDAPLSNLMCADKPGKMEMRLAVISKPYIAILATDGAYSSLVSPMEFEMLLLDTLKKAKSFADWEKKLGKQLAKNAQDDATLLLVANDFDNITHVKNHLMPRREQLQKQWITPSRRHRGDAAYLHQKWLQYKLIYDQTGERYE